jgi:hypothetical protein
VSLRARAAAARDLRARAERCLAREAPTPAEAHELAAVALEVLATLGSLEQLGPLDSTGQPGQAGPTAATADPARGHPYRTSSAAPARSTPGAAHAGGRGSAASDAPEPRTMAALERALEDCERRLREASAKLASLTRARDAAGGDGGDDA